MTLAVVFAGAGLFIYRSVALFTMAAITPEQGDSVESRGSIATSLGQRDACICYRCVIFRQDRGLLCMAPGRYPDQC